MAAPDEPEPRAEAFPALWPVPTRWADDDHYGHVDAVSYYSYFDTAINGWLMASTGLDVRRLPAIGIVTEASCRFVRELSFPDQLHVGLSVERIEVSDIVYALAVFREDAEPGSRRPPTPARAHHRVPCRARRRPARPIRDRTRT
ncbi:acyl-CoA thioesterase [Rhodococcus hoagii]|nr:acyl-CoA thioesterase [Prescottella equi]